MDFCFLKNAKMGIEIGTPSYLVSIILIYQFPKTMFADFCALILDFNSISSHFNSITSHLNSISSYFDTFSSHLNRINSSQQHWETAPTVLWIIVAHFKKSTCHYHSSERPLFSYYLPEIQPISDQKISINPIGRADEFN